MQIGPQIFKRTSRGDIQVYHIERDGAKYRSVTGKRGGKMVVSAWTTCEAKNVGKANELTPEQQAISEVDAKYTKKLRQDFHATTDSIDTVTRVKPMLAKKWADYADRFAPDELLLASIKYDGYRTLVTRDGAFTRDGLPMHCSIHILEDLAPVFQKYPNLQLDGEQWSETFKHDFNKIGSLLKKQTPSMEHLVEVRTHIKYYIYDVPSMLNDTAQERDLFLTKLFDEFNIEFCVHVKQHVVTKDTIFDFYEQCLQDKHEGAMAKVANGKYETKRSKNLLKLKEFQTEEFPLIRIENGRGSRSDIAARAIVQLPNGNTAEVGIIGSHEYCKDLLDNQQHYIGKPAEIQFLNFTPDGSIRGGKLKQIRLFS
jgi:DNA ligase-1